MLAEREQKKKNAAVRKTSTGQEKRKKKKNETFVHTRKEIGFWEEKFILAYVALSLHFVEQQTEAENTK